MYKCTTFRFCNKFSCKTLVKDNELGTKPTAASNIIIMSVMYLITHFIDRTLIVVDIDTLPFILIKLLTFVPYLYL